MTSSLAAGSIPRLQLGTFPTPMHEAPRLSAELGISVWLKRDDLTGFGLGGNKVRVLEFLLAGAREQGFDCLVTGAGPQSNWAFLAALAARREGMDPHLCFYGDPPGRIDGNYRLQALAGSTICWTGIPDRASVDPLIDATAQRLREQGRSPLVLPRGGATGVGSIGYVLGAAEIGSSMPGATVWLATGSCGTQAGLVAGRAAAGLGRVVGVTVSRPVQECEQRVHRLGCEAADLVGLARPPEDCVDVRGGWIGPGYGQPSSDGFRAAQLLARTEGVLVDPVFGAKALAALIDAAGTGQLDGPVVFLVSGGAPTMLLSDSSGS